MINMNKMISMHQDFSIADQKKGNGLAWIERQQVDPFQKVCFTLPYFHDATSFPVRLCQDRGSNRIACGDQIFLDHAVTFTLNRARKLK
jgi:hypothetical protein